MRPAFLRFPLMRHVAQKSESAPPRALLILLGALAAFSPLSIDMYLPGLPAIGVEFGAGAAGMQSTLSLFLFGLASGQFIYGPLSDRLGRRPPLIAGISLYLIATLGCSFAQSIEALAAFRLLQGLGGCAGVVISRAVVADRFRGAEAARALSMLMLIMGVAPVIAPIAGAMIGSAFGWRAIFFIQLALALVTGLCALRFLPESRSETVANQARAEGAVRAYGALLSNRRFCGYVMAAAFCNASLLAYIATIPGLLVGHFSIRPDQVGWFFAVMSFVVIGSNQINRTLLLRREPDWLLRRAVLLSIAPAAALIVVAAAGWGGLWSFIPLVLLASAPFGFVQSNASARGFAMEPLRAGSASALFGAGGYAAGALSGWSVSLLHDGTPVPVAAAMFVCLCMSALTCLFLAQRQPSSNVVATT
jgi:DHA1 family bicyclomycin/chloramphenicol resistance-like MFS transporter